MNKIALSTIIGSALLGMIKKGSRSELVPFNDLLLDKGKGLIFVDVEVPYRKAFEKTNSYTEFGIGLGVNNALKETYNLFSELMGGHSEFEEAREIAVQEGKYTGLNEDQQEELDEKIKKEIATKIIENFDEQISEMTDDHYKSWLYDNTWINSDNFFYDLLYFDFNWDSKQPAAVDLDMDRAYDKIYGDGQDPGDEFYEQMAYDTCYKEAVGPMPLNITFKFYLNDLLEMYGENAVFILMNGGWVKDEITRLVINPVLRVMKMITDMDADESSEIDLATIKITTRINLNEPIEPSILRVR